MCAVMTDALMQHLPVKNLDNACRAGDVLIRTVAVEQMYGKGKCRTITLTKESVKHL